MFGPGFCANPITGAARSVPEAIASAKRFLDRTAGPGAAEQFAASPEYQDADRAETAAAAAVVAGRPGAALAALVRAHELEPAEASHLVNAAALASSVGLPAEALAMLDGARRLDDPDHPGMGVPRHAVALANRGQALALLGRHVEADGALDGALAAEPLLTEASATQAATTVCRQDAKAAVRHRRKGKQRQGTKPLDPSHGKESLLRDLTLPAFPEQAATMKPFYQGQHAKLMAETDAWHARNDAFEDRLRAKKTEWSPAQRDRYRAVRALVSTAHEEPDVKALKTEYFRRNDLVMQTQYAFWGEGTDPHGRFQAFHRAASDACASAYPFRPCYVAEMQKTCRPALRLAHQTWLDQMQDTHDAAQRYVRAVSKRMSGYAAHLADEDAHGEAMLAIESVERSTYGLVYSPAHHWVHPATLYVEECVAEPDAPSGGPDGAAPVADSGMCGTGLKTINVVATLGPTKLKVNCERVQQSIKLEVMPWLQAYADVTYNTRTGKVSIFAGSKGEISGGGVKGSFKSGIYVSTDRSGVVDAGWRVGPTVAVESGPYEFEAVKDEIDISFVGSTSPTYGL
jgi:hypothetical protein